MSGDDVGASRTTIAATATMDIGMTTMIVPYRRYQYGYGDYGPRWGGYGWRRGWHNDNEQGNDDEQ
jgi:hypothetical protein